MTTTNLPEHIEANILSAEDGYKYYWPDGGGMYAARHLREIADRLDELNAEWGRQVEDELEQASREGEP